ncbi:hypothetical protein Hdeb2414_s0198g00830481 [Helianthus debilis subsp. tardiflorus]
MFGLTIKDQGYRVFDVVYGDGGVNGRRCHGRPRRGRGPTAVGEKKKVGLGLGS